MENFRTPWYSWCRLCGNEDPENNVSIHLPDMNQRLGSGECVKSTTLKEALKKYFLVQSSTEDRLPKHLCPDCYSIISSIMLFHEHVERVQQMYKYLMDNPLKDSYDLQSLRLQFDVCDVNRGEWCRSQNKSESVYNDDETGGLTTVHIKHENWSLESDHSDYEDPFGTVSKDYVYDDEQEIDDSGTADINTPAKKTNYNMYYKVSKDKNIAANSNKINHANTVLTSKQKISQSEWTEVHCEKESITEQIEQQNPIANDSQEKVVEPFDAMSDDSVWGEDEEKLASKGATNRSTNYMYAIYDDGSGAGTSRQGLLTEKKNFGEDFMLDLPCLICDQKFDHYSAYCEHMEVTHNNTNMDKYCPLCDRTLQTWYHMGKHMRIHMPMESRFPIKCPECDKRYNTSAQLEVHVNHKHRNAKPFICEVCGFCGATKTSLTQHMYIHSDNMPFECEVCKKRFKKRSVLNIHMDIHGPNKFVCSICGLQLNTRATLKNHLLVHSNVKRHKCEGCGASFKQSKALKAHLILHLGLKPYSCNFCERAYSNRTGCRTHMKKMHPDEVAALEASGKKPYTENVPTLEKLKEITKTTDNLRAVEKYGRKNNANPKACFPCEFCDRKFAHRPNWQFHMKTKHPDESSSLKTRKAAARAANRKARAQPVTCLYCGRSFGNRKLCRNHMKRLHPEELAELEPLGKETHTKNITELETLNELNIEVVDNIDELQTMDEESPPNSNLDIKPLNDNDTVTICESLPATDIQNGNSPAPTLFLITIPGYPSVSVSK